MHRLLRLTLLVVLAALGLACASTASPAEAPSATPGAAATPQPAPAASQVGAWKTFRSERYRFEFRYPDSCGVIERDGSFHIGGRIELAVIDSNESNLSEYVTSFINDKVSTNGWTVESRSSRLVAGKEAITVEYRFGGSNRYGTATFIRGNGRVHVWGLTAGGFSCDEQLVYNPILSSFRFIE